MSKAKEKVGSFPQIHHKVLPIMELFQAKVQKLPNQSVIVWKRQALTRRKCLTIEVICIKCKKKSQYATMYQSFPSKCRANLLENSTDPADGNSIVFYEENGTLVYMAETHMLSTVINKSIPSKENLLMEFQIRLNYSNLMEWSC